MGEPRGIKGMPLTYLSPVEYKPLFRDFIVKNRGLFIEIRYAIAHDQVFTDIGKF
jgi:hypothetical protein